jgi:hypothetical protein
MLTLGAVHLVHVTGMVTSLDARLTSAPGLAVARLDSPGRALAAAGPRTLRDIPNEVASSPAITPCPGWAAMRAGVSAGCRSLGTASGVSRWR